MIKKLAQSIREFKKDSILSAIFMCFEVTMEVVIPILMANLIDYGIDKGNMPFILKMGIALLISAAISLFFGIMSGQKAAIASAGFAKNLRKDMYYKVQDYSFSNIDKFSTASIVTRLTTDVTNVQNSYQMIIRMAVRAPIMLIFSLFAAFTIDLKLSLIFLVTVPILGIGLWFVMTKVHPIFKRVFKTYDKLNSIVQENLHGIRVVKSFVREDFEIDKFKDVSNEIYKDFSKAEKTVAYNAPLMQFCMYATTIFISWFGARAIVASGGDANLGLSTGELMSLLSYATQILSSLMMLSMVIVMITISRASAERIVEVLDEEIDLKNSTSPVMTVNNGDIEFKNVNFSYSKNADKLCLNNINIKINSGDTVGVLGGTGSSKSSLIQLIPRLYDVTAGSVKVGGIDVRDYDIETLRNEVAVVLKLAEAHSFIKTFSNGYDTYIEQGGTNVSGGQKQRLCIARALLKKPKILILDDSTSAVDTKTDALIRKAFKEEIPNTTKIIIAQRVSSIQDADKIIVMDDGKVTAMGTHEELLKSSEIYKEVYESQMKGGSDNE